MIIYLKVIIRPIEAFRGPKDSDNNNLDKSKDDLSNINNTGF